MLRRPEQFRIDGPRRPTPPPEGVRQHGRNNRHTLGSIIWLAMIRLFLTIFVAWYLKDHLIDLTYGEWWTITAMAIYGIAIYPAQIQYTYFKRTSKRLIEETLCSSCRYFNPEGLHCMKLDEHVSEHYLPCEGEGWEPKSFEDN